MSSKINKEDLFIINGSPVTIEDVIDVGKGRKVKLSNQKVFLDRIGKSKELLDEKVKNGIQIYGATTSYGDAVTTIVHPDSSVLLNFAALYNSGCGVGADLSPEMGRSILFARLICISQGYSGVSEALLRQMELFLDKNLSPVIPEEGSVGASGDLIPMSYVAAALMGKRRIYYQGKIRDTAEVLKELSIQPYTFQTKEVLAVINSTNVMSALACEAWHRAEYFSRLSVRITALVSLALMGNKEHFHPNLFMVRKHKGPKQVAEWVTSDLRNYTQLPSRLQDRYSVRCAPHVIGVLIDALVWMRRDIEDEINSVNDNPIVDIEAREVYFGGHFYGGYIAFAMDSLCAAVASVADLLERQMTQLVDSKFSNGLPPNLSGASPEDLPVSLAFKNFQIALSSFVAEAQKLTIPAAVFSRSTESHNQDKVSMGTISARYALRIMTLAEQVAAGCLLAVIQAIDLRLVAGSLSKNDLGPILGELFDDFRKDFNRLEKDRDLDLDLKKCILFVSQMKWQPYV